MSTNYRLYGVAIDSMYQKTNSGHRVDRQIALNSRRLHHPHLILRRSIRPFASSALVGPLDEEVWTTCRQDHLARPTLSKSPLIEL